jgi:GcrA cell cycle regulator
MMKWTKENNERLIQLVNEGKTFGQIGDIFGLTRNAIAGAAARLHIRSLVKPGGSKKKENPVRLPRNVKVSEPEKPVIQEAPLLRVVSRSIVDLDYMQCKFPIGDPSDEEFHFCQENRLENKPYCQKHCDIAYVKPRFLTAK